MPLARLGLETAEVAAALREGADDWVAIGATAPGAREVTQEFWICRSCRKAFGSAGGASSHGCSDSDSPLRVRRLLNGCSRCDAAFPSEDVLRSHWENCHGESTDRAPDLSVQMDEVVNQITALAAQAAQGAAAHFPPPQRPKQIFSPLTSQ